ncbi:MAG TPA: ATP-binding protein, partial [Pirellulales bacterium]
IGLAIVLRAVGRHGGKVWFESGEGQGTTFFVSLPTPREQPASLALVCEGLLASEGKFGN